MFVPSRRIARLLLVFCLMAIFLIFLPSSLLTGDRPQRKSHERYDTHPIYPLTTPHIAPPKVAQRKKPSKVLGTHKFRSDGLLEVNPDGPHPIHELIVRAEKKWAEKLGRASQTLDVAVEEYWRRYRRAPPKGFDVWWQYVIDHNIQLPDEYDQIFNDLEPFWGIEPTDLHKIQQQLELKKDTYTIGKNDEGKVDVLTYAFEEGRYDQLIVGSEGMVQILRTIEDLLPSFRATFSPHDGPNRLSDYGVKAAALEAAHSKSYIEKDALPKISGTGWRYACPPTSQARMKPVNLDKPPPPPTKKTFIYDHLLTMDPCRHPDHFHHHGQFLSHDMGPTPQETMVPEFCQCSTTIHHNIRVPTPYGWMEDIYPRSDDPPFDEKIEERLSWRGRMTGMFHSSGTRWHNSHRDFLVRFANEINGTVNVLATNKTKTERVGEPISLRKARINPAIMDVAFAEGPIACSESTCHKLEQLYPFRPMQEMKEAGLYKYVIDVDGNGWSGRFKRLITTNALIFKSTIYPEWYADRVVPWVHYIPIQLDLSDLHDALIFFRGDANGDGAHEDLARKIALAGREWSKTFWRKEDIIAYFFRLILEYKRLMSVDREAMSYIGPEDED